MHLLALVLSIVLLYLKIGPIIYVLIYGKSEREIIWYKLELVKTAVCNGRSDGDKYTLISPSNKEYECAWYYYYQWMEFPTNYFKNVMTPMAVLERGVLG